MDIEGRGFVLNTTPARFIEWLEMFVSEAKNGPFRVRSIHNFYLSEVKEVEARTVWQPPTRDGHTKIKRRRLYMDAYYPVSDVKPAPRGTHIVTHEVDGRTHWLLPSDDRPKIRMRKVVGPREIISFDIDEHAPKLIFVAAVSEALFHQALFVMEYYEQLLESMLQHWTSGKEVAPQKGSLQWPTDPRDPVINRVLLAYKQPDPLPEDLSRLLTKVGQELGSNLVNALKTAHPQETEYVLPEIKQAIGPKRPAKREEYRRLYKDAMRYKEQGKTTREIVRILGWSERKIQKILNFGAQESEQKDR